MTAGPPPSHSQASPESLLGRTVSCGPYTHQRLARLLGLDREPIVWKVTAATWARDQLEIELSRLHDRSALSLVLARATPDGAFVTGPEVCLWARQSAIPPELGTRLQAVTRRMLERLPFRDLERMVALDPDAAEPAVQPPGAGGEASGPLLDGISIPTVAAASLEAPELYADFFAASEIRRAGCDIIDVHSAHTLVSHGDVECSYCGVCVPRPRAALVRLPVYETVRNIGRAPTQYGAFDESEDPAKAFCSDMSEEDVIKGSPGRLERVLRHADQHRNRDDLLVVGLCLPDVIGEDQEGAVRQFAGTTTTPVYSVPASPRSWAWLAKDMLRTRRQALPQTAPDPKAVNLIGFPRNPGTRELVSLLAQAGISVSTQLLPELGMNAVRRIPGAALNVYLTNVHWEKTYEHLQDDPGRQHLVMDGPYGLRGTRRWLQQIFSALGEQVDVDQLCSRRMTALAPHFDSLRRRASSCRLGLVVASSEADTLTDARYSWGIRLTEVLQELGFGIDLFIGGAHADKAASGFRARTQLAPQEYTLTLFDSLPGMLDALQRSPCQAVFSNYMFDWRLIRTGKMPFSTLEFEAGLSGAIATLQRLIAVCNLPLFRLGRRFMSSGPAGGTDDR